MRRRFPLFAALILLAPFALQAATPPVVMSKNKPRLSPDGTSVLLAVVADDDNQEVRLLYMWDLADGPAPVRFDPNGSCTAKNTTVTFARAGDYTLRCAIVDAECTMVTTTFAVKVPQKVTSIEVTPAMANVLVNTTKKFKAVAKDQFGQDLVNQPPLSWMVDSPAGAEAPAGGRAMVKGELNAGGAVGTCLVSAVYTAKGAGITGSTEVNIVDASAPSIVQAPAAADNPVVTKSVALSMLGADDGGEPALIYAWSVAAQPENGEATFSVNDCNAARQTVATFTAAGRYRFVGTVSDAQRARCEAFVDVDVQAIPATPIRVYPGSETIAPSDARQFKAASIDQFGLPIHVYDWSISGGGTIDATGLVRSGPEPGGPFTVTATAHGFSGAASITVLDAAASFVSLAVIRSTNSDVGEPLTPAEPFNAATFAASPERYLERIEPQRVWEMAPAGPDTPALSARGDVNQTATANTPVTLAAVTTAHMPVTFASLDGGVFGNGSACVSVRADEQGLARVTFTPSPLIPHTRILAASPVASGMVVYRVDVK